MGYDVSVLLFAESPFSPVAEASEGGRQILETVEST